MAKVELTFTRWTEDHQTRLDRGETIGQLLCRKDDLTVDGETLNRWKLVLNQDDFVSIEIMAPSPEMVKRYEDPATHLWGTRDGLLILPVTEMVIA